MKKNTLRRLPSIPLEPELDKRLADYCRRTGATQTAAVKLALAAFLPVPPSFEGEVSNV